ncbi:MAG: hypothetical protein NTY19_07055 [Planctomycetota bacterium]|nr:hypothetical protein [Planctomycetota bacterium]
MIAPAKSRRPRKSVPAWHAKFLEMMPAIKAHAKIAFRHLDPEAREEAIQEVVCNACCAFSRLVELGRTDLAYPSPLARYGVAQAKDGRKVGGHLNCKDVLSEHCQRRKHLTIERLDKFDAETDAWEEILVEDKHAGPADIAVSRLDFAAWLRTLPSRLRKIAKVLATGENTGAAARAFRVSPGRISQLRNELRTGWLRFRGDADGDAVPA